jgi:hypothetical protein
VVVDGETTSTSPQIGQQSLTRRGAQANTTLTDSRRLFGWINFAPSFNASGAIYDFDNIGNRVVPTGTWSASVTTGTTLYGTALPRLGPILGIRHVLSPRVSFAYSPDFPHLLFVDSLGIQRERFASFGSIGVSGFKAAAMRFDLDQRFQMKLQRNGKVERLDNLVSWFTSGSYNFLWKEQRRAHPLSPLTSNIRLQPPGNFSADLGWVTDVYHPRPLRSLGYNLAMSLIGRGNGSAAAPPVPNSAAATGAPELPLDKAARVDEVNPNEPWSLSLAFSYQGGYLGRDWSSTQTANGVLHYNLTTAWGLEYSASYDVNGHDLLTQNFSLTRDLHCWAASFTRTFTLGGEAEYYFRLGVKDQKEIYIERGNRFGTLGGIQ